MGSKSCLVKRSSASDTGDDYPDKLKLKAEILKHSSGSDTGDDYPDKLKLKAEILKHSSGSDTDDNYPHKLKVESLDLALEKLNLGPKKKKKLIVLSLNGLLIHRVHRYNKSEIPKNRSPDGIYNRHRFVYKRPFLEGFLKFCLEKFEVGIWSSAPEHNIDYVLDCAFKGLRSKLFFVWDQDHCSDSGFMSLEKAEKPLFFKELSKLLKSLGRSSRGAHFSESNILLIDDLPYKGLLNPPNTGIFPEKYDAENVDDNVLGPKGELRNFLEGLADADEDVPSYVKEHPFGQPVIGPGHRDWDFYSKVLPSLKD